MPNDELLKKMQVEIAVLRMLSLVSWSTLLRTMGGDPVEQCREASTRMEAAVRKSNTEPVREGQVDVLNETLQELDRFWGGVAGQLGGTLR